MPHSCSFCFLFLFNGLPKAGTNNKKEILEENKRKDTKKRELHELLNTEIVKSVTISIRLASGVSFWLLGQKSSQLKTTVLSSLL